MDEIIAQIADNTGLDPDRARRAAGIIINFLRREGPPEQVQSLLSGIPGAEALADQFGGEGTGLMGVYGDLSAAGLGMGEIQSVTREFVTIARAKAGEPQVDALVASIPGLSQFV